MQRDLYQNLRAWRDKNGRKPLVLQGARQVGKTHLIRYFVENEFENHIYLNFEHEPSLADYFDGKLDPKRIIENLAVLYGVQIKPESTCLIFDEVQECPSALNSLKYFCEQAPEYPVISAGSLLGVKLSNKGFPVGKVDFLTLRPLNFLEYLKAAGHEQWCEYLTKLPFGEKVPVPLHEELLRAFQFYIILGGMPAVLKTYFETNDLHEARAKQLEIIQAYQLDFSKHAPANQVIRISEVWNSIPAQLAKENKKFIFSVIAKSARARDYDLAIEWLKQAGLVQKVKLCTTPKLPLSGYVNNDIYKLYLLDVGLLGALSNLPLELAVQPDTLFSEFKGSLVENYVFQEILLLQENNFYWTSSGSAEIDMLYSKGTDTYPLEIKSGLTKHKKSLLVYRDKYAPKLLIRTNPNNVDVQDGFVNIPLYMVRQGLEKLG